MNKVELITITEDHCGQRIDNFLLARLKGVPKSHIYRILRKGEVRVNKKRIKAPYKLAIGDLVRIPPIRLSESATPEINIKLDRVKRLERSIIYESESVIVMNKPSGIAVHGGSGVSFGVIEALRQLRPEARFLELVHRLDRDTSGCLLIAKKRSALRFLHEQLRDKKMRKDYLALVVGSWPKRTKVVDAPLLKYTLKSGERMVKVSQEGKPSETKFAIERQYQSATLIRCSPITGRTHQIRVHTQFVGCPIVGDNKYGNQGFDSELLNDFGFNRLFLHAKTLTFREKRGADKITIEADLDSSLAELLDKIA
ncbi:MAG: 23S rRNA pseudouridine(955/2504/2580) synthase RluC [Kangiellaceae bacterium]|nr:23S rRNA pseudouridine(955/2504/2580) synthase RluC [Kangiellaceae bacterium]